MLARQQDECCWMTCWVGVEPWNVVEGIVRSLLELTFHRGTRSSKRPSVTQAEYSAGISGHT